MIGSSAITQRTGTTVSICPDLCLPDALESRQSQILWQTSTKQSADGNSVVVVIMKILTLHYHADTCAVDGQKGKIYAIFPYEFAFNPRAKIVKDSE